MTVLSFHLTSEPTEEELCCFTPGEIHQIDPSAPFLLSPRPMQCRDPVKNAVYALRSLVEQSRVSVPGARFVFSSPASVNVFCDETKADVVRSMLEQCPYLHTIHQTG